MSVSVQGDEKFVMRLLSLAQAGPEIAEATARAGCRVMAAACVSAAPGSTKQEMGYHVRTEGKKVIGRAGIMRFPKRGRTRGPHGVYLDQGTKFITARRFVSAALRSSRPRALAAMRGTFKRRVRSVAEK